MAEEEFRPTPSLAMFLDQYKINANSFQKEMEALGLPSPAGARDINWQQNARQLLGGDSPSSSPRKMSPLGHVPALTANGHLAYLTTVDEEPAGPQYAVGHAPVTTIYPAPQYHNTAGPNWGSDLGFPSDQPARAADPAPGAIADLTWAKGMPLPSEGSGLVDNPVHAVISGHAVTFPRQSFDGVSAITARLGSQTLDSGANGILADPRSNADEPLAQNTLQRAVQPVAQNWQQQAAAAMPQLLMGDVMPRQTHYVTTGMLDEAAHAARVQSAVLPMQSLGSASGAPAFGPGSAPVGGLTPVSKILTSAVYQKRGRSVRSQLTFEAYENQYGPSAKCESGPCADHCITPCKAHTCKCCKKWRRVEVLGAARSKGGYCGKCNRREKVDGLEFVKCNHTVYVDGVPQVCSVEMLRDVFDNHWKQHKNEPHDEGLPTYLDVDTDEGRKCGACTNMRPVTYYPDQDTNCSCSHCQIVKSKGNTSNTRRVSTSGGTASAFHRASVRRNSFTSMTPGNTCMTPGTPHSGPLPSFSGINSPDNGHDHSNSPPASMLNIQVQNINFPATDFLASPGTEQLVQQGWIQRPGNSGSSKMSATPDWAAAGDIEPLVQQAESMLSSALASVMSARMSFDALLARVRQQNGESSDTHAGLQRVLRAGQQVEKQVQQMMAQASAVRPTSSDSQ